MAFNSGSKALWAIGGLLFFGGFFVWVWARGQVDSLGFANELSLGLGLGGSEDYLGAVGLVAASGVVMDFGAGVLLLALAISALGEFILRAGRDNTGPRQESDQGS